MKNEGPDFPAFFIHPEYKNLYIFTSHGLLFINSFSIAPNHFFFDVDFHLQTYVTDLFAADTTYVRREMVKNRYKYNFHLKFEILI